MSSAILVVAHGSRRAAANADLLKIADMIAAQRPAEIVEIGYLELTTPSIPDGLRACAARGATSVAILPYFLSAGAHVSSDLVEFRQAFIEEFPQISCVVCPPLGIDSRLIDLMLDRLAEGRCQSLQHPQTSSGGIESCEINPVSNKS